MGESKDFREAKKLLDLYFHLLTLSETLSVSVSEEGEMIKDMMIEHPEYTDFLDEEEIELENGTIMNPRLHITIEAALQIQIAKGYPPEVRKAYLTLIDEGLDAHAARHAVGRIFTETIWLVMRNKLSMDPINYYRSQLRDLMRKKLKHHIFKN